MKVACAALPHGTVSAQRTTLTVGLARSSIEVMLPGLLGGTAISSVLVAKVRLSLTMLLSSGAAAAVPASAMTEAGAPLSTCCTRVALEP